MKKQHFASVIGVGAFVIGGLLARAHALEAIETLETMYEKHKKPAPPADQD